MFHDRQHPRSVSQRAAFANRAIATTAAILMVLTLLANAQPVSDDAALEELRRRAPSGAGDDQIMDDWINSQLSGLNRETAAAFINRLGALRLAPDTDPQFVQRLSVRLGERAKAEFAKGNAFPADAADTVVRALIETNDIGVVPGLTAALTFPATEVRYLSAKGLQGFRDRIEADINLMRSVVAALKQAGIQETNGVVVERIYRALSFAGAAPEVIDAAADILQARVDRYRKGSFPDDLAEVALCDDYLAGLSLTQTQAVRFVQPLAVLLRLDVEHYAAAGAQVRHWAIEQRVDSCERLLEKLVGSAAAQGGFVRNAMQAGGAGVGPAVRLGLLEWIGSPQKRGVLNAAPWNVPVGAP